MKKINKIDMYLRQANQKLYSNTDREQELLNKFLTLYQLTKSAQEKHEAASPANLLKWRKAYKFVLNALDISTGEESTRKSRQLRKLCYEIVESTVDNNIPSPKMTPRHKIDVPLVEVTENYLKYELNDALTLRVNDRSERATYIDGTCWYKVGWDSLSNSHDRSGNITIDVKTVDNVFPQPGVIDYKQLEYIFELDKVSISRLYDLYGRVISPVNDTSDSVEVVYCYYLNNDRLVGLFAFTPHSLQVVANEETWLVRKVRKCTLCNTVNSDDLECRNCGNTTFKYENATEEILSDDLYEIYNPYEAGENNDPSKKNEYSSRIFAAKGTTVPFYQIRQLPFVPRQAVSYVDSIYGLSEVRLVLDEQDATNKLLTKAVDKTLKSGAIVSKPRKLKLSDVDDSLKVLDVNSSEEAQMINSKQILADTSQDLALSAIIYDNAKAASGITDSFQGKRDTTATSGKAKQYAALQSAGRIESTRVMKSAAFAGIYELVFKYLLAFSDEQRNFVRVLADGTEEEMMWNKYMFLAKDNYNKIYYRDDFTFTIDNASTLNQNREAMWQETTNKFVQGAFGAPNDLRTLKLYWNTMLQLQYPLAKIALTGISENEQHLPPELEQAIMTNPQIMQTISNMLKNEQSGSGGARIGAGQKGNGATHSANVQRTNERNRIANAEQLSANQQGGI